ncbi:efflux RND transporter periplasmic adaptor subunit [Roseomonas sp. CCTCC AB2023176]|uniref:efflux RND transporter periplasmic adaptor subunit n=1 Tax=Roseomonas sp. CCTCC AB2023176 TaxID=3342640 RepID=UPI0035DAAB81
MTVRRRSRGARALRWLLVLLVLGGAGYGGWYWWSHRQAPAEQGAAGPGRRGGAPRIPVTVVAAERRDVNLTLDALGTVTPLESVVIRTQLDGQLTEVLFREGDEVEAGQVIARVDDRAVQASLAQAAAKKALDEAQLANARNDLRRYEQLVRASGATQQQVDTTRAQVAQYEAQVRQDEAAIESARTTLSFATIRSPIAGRVGLRQVDAGNIVRGSDTNGLVTVTRMAPMGVNFTVPQQELPRLRRALTAGPVPVETLPAPGEARDAPRSRGTVLTVDNAVDATTGTIRVRATFPNEDRVLWPGAFVNVRIRIEVVPQSVVVPLVAVQRGPEGSYVFIVKDDQTIEQRNVTVGQTTMSEAVIRTGVQAGERVVTSGGLRLNNGTAVVVSDGPPPVRSGAGQGGPRRGGGEGGRAGRPANGGNAGAAEGAGNAPAAAANPAAPNATAPAAPAGGASR